MSTDYQRIQNLMCRHNDESIISAPGRIRTCDLRFRNSTQTSAPNGRYDALSDNSADSDIEQSAPECNIGAPNDAPREDVTQSAGIPQSCDPSREGGQNSDKSRRPRRGELMAALVGLWVARLTRPRRYLLSYSTSDFGQAIGCRIRRFISRASNSTFLPSKFKGVRTSGCRSRNRSPSAGSDRVLVLRQAATDGAFGSDPDDLCRATSTYRTAA